MFVSRTLLRPKRIRADLKSEKERGIWTSVFACQSVFVEKTVAAAKVRSKQFDF